MARGYFIFMSLILRFVCFSFASACFAFENLRRISLLPGVELQMAQTETGDSHRTFSAAPFRSRTDLEKRL